MRREFLLNLLFLVFVNVLIKPLFIFGIDLGVQNRAEEGAYGLYFALLFLAYIFQIISDCGIQNFTNTHVSRHPQLMAKYFPNLLALKLLLSAAYLVLAPLGAWAVFGYGAKEMPLLLILLCNQALVQMTFFLRSNVSGLGHYRLDSVLSTLDKLLMLATCGALLRWPPAEGLRMEHFALAQTLALALTCIVAFVALRNKADFSLRPTWAGNWRAGKAALLVLLKKSWPFAMVVLLMTAYTRLDAVLLERLLPDGPAHADVYAGAYRLLDACNMLGYLFASLLLPMFARLLAQAPDGSTARPLASLGFRLIWAGSITLATLVFFARADLLRLMMPERASAYRWEVLGLLIWTFVPVSTTYIFSTMLTAGEKLRAMNRFFVWGIALDLLLNLILVPRFQAYGAAISTLLTQWFVAGAMIWLCIQYYGFRPTWRNVGGLLGFVAFLWAGCWAVFTYVAVAWPWQCALGAGVALVGSLLFRLVDLGQLRRFKNAKKQSDKLSA